MFCKSVCLHYLPSSDCVHETAWISNLATKITTQLEGTAQQLDVERKELEIEAKEKGTVMLIPSYVPSLLECRHQIERLRSDRRCAWQISDVGGDEACQRLLEERVRELAHVRALHSPIRDSLKDKPSFIHASLSVLLVPPMAMAGCLDYCGLQVLSLLGF